jgi:hypothetical protein
MSGLSKSSTRERFVRPSEGGNEESNGLSYTSLHAEARKAEGERVRVGREANVRRRARGRGTYSRRRLTRPLSDGTDVSIVLLWIYLSIASVVGGGCQRALLSA